MKVYNDSTNFRGIHLGRLRSIDRIYVCEISPVKQLAKNIDVFIKSTNHNYPSKYGMMEVPSIKISVMPKGLNFLERLFCKKKIIEYFPVGNLRKTVNYDKSFLDVFNSACADFYKKFNK